MNQYVLIEEEQKNHAAKIKDIEEEMEEVFSRKVHKKEEKLERWQTQEISFIEKEQDEIKKNREMVEFEKRTPRGAAPKPNQLNLCWQKL